MTQIITQQHRKKTNMKTTITLAAGFILSTLSVTSASACPPSNNPVFGGGTVNSQAQAHYGTGALNLTTTQTNMAPVTSSITGTMQNNSRGRNSGPLNQSVSNNSISSVAIGNVSVSRLTVDD
jgi:hypothetical protein